jgi:tRNA (Thr-GGU) A37 N-methylase
VLHVDREKGVLEIDNIDAFDDTVVVDIKAYYGCTDRVRECRTPSWLPDWGEWVPEGGIGLE